MKIRLGINGFGRIGRSVFRHLLNNKNISIVGINDLTDTSTLAHLLKYDSTYGALDAHVSYQDSTLFVEKKSIKIFSESNPTNISWKDLDVDIVIESTGKFTKKEDAFCHIIAGAKKVIISAPSPDAKTIVIGVNEEKIEKNDYVISNASCTTNCLAPIAKIIDEKFGVEKGYITTTHAFTADQRLQDSPHKDLRRARSATNAIIPTKTGAASAVGKVLPKLNGKLDGIALRVPVSCGSIVDLVCEVKTSTNAAEVNKAIKDHINENNLSSIITVCDDPIVSSDIIGTTESAIVDSALTSVNQNIIKLLAWYDNESAYSKRLIDLAELAATSEK
ncbi:MAG: type I glyceraldehyde-3-phosphate dehydrogenase [Flavobacteriales bacterium]|nr:type I glyceraldehyde-3-phosphate dehydrogenase [Flavobacteriales bacterium]|tara:strand:+ start:2057 stop:3058 length:1002 start_codon:yes stop_codon:yes gene_type:complete